MKYIYPAVFSPVEEGGFAIWFPDLPGTNSQGMNWEEALDMARNALASWLDYLLDKGKDIPPASNPAVLTVDSGDFVTLIDANVEQFRRIRDNRAVKKTLTIPAALDAAATAQGLNFSRELQERLKQSLGMAE